MAYLVDGNNVMGQTPGWHRDKPGSRRRLLDELAAFAAATKTRVTVVFDGAPAQGFPDGSSYRGVKIHYPRRGSDADSVIERLVAASTDRRGLTVVTSDRQLAAEVRGLGGRVMRSGEFRRQMAEATVPVAVDPGESAAPAEGSVDEWLRYFGLDDKGKKSSHR